MNSPGFLHSLRTRAALVAALLLPGGASAASEPPLQAAIAAPAAEPAILAADTPATWFNALVDAVAGPAPDISTLPPPPKTDPDDAIPFDANGCRTLYRANDPRLFDFVHTRAKVHFRKYEGLPISRLAFITLPVFNEDDPEEDRGLYRLVNRLHIPTRMTPIRRQLLVRAGDPVDDDLIRESERILRDADYLYDAMILPGEVCPDGIELLVVVRDVWTLKLNASLKRTGGENTSSFSISDDNILGYGHSLSLSYAKNPARESIGINYESKHLVDGHTRLALDYSDNSDGNAKGFAFERPFYALDARWAAGVSAGNNSLRQTIEANGVITNEYDHESSEAEVYFGVSPGLRNEVAHRFRGGYTRSTDRYSNQDPLYTDPLPVDQVLAYPWLEYAGVENNYITTSNYTQMFRNEDLQIGATWQVRLGSASEETGATERAWIGRLAYTDTLSADTTHLMKAEASADMFWIRDAGQFENSLYTWKIDYTRFLDERNRWYALGQLDAGINLDEAHQLTAGGEIYLRGYPNYWQRGDRRAVVSTERRHYFKVHVLNLIRIGAAAFFDMGQAWDSDGDIEQSDNVLANAGFGLRLTSSKANSNRVLHMNIAFPLTDRRDAGDHQWSVYTEAKF